MIAIGAYAAFLIIAVALAAKVGQMQLRHYEALRVRRGGAARRRGRMLSIGGLTVLGFGLVAAGAIVLLAILGHGPSTVLGALTFVATRLAVLSIVLGITHFNCLAILSRAVEEEVDVRPAPPADRGRPRRGREDPLDRVFEAARLNAPSGL